ncbi:MAG: tRNA pseudouridine(38-40) synthase TruA [Rhodospirillaceae bacterium]|nr:MAG: tRNA pseudouridine(38-40) synthase TruA [Rhodospirillaceae bacterium]
MTRYRLTIEYDGTAYVGWQRQDNGLGVQEVIEDAIKAFSGEDVRVFCAGRTDAGVHAKAQIAHFDLARDDMKAHTVRDAINYHTKPHAISILAAEIVDEDFHARFSATEREYLYVILNRRSRAALQIGQVWWVPVPLDAAAMNEAAQILVGKHDFSTFRASFCQADSPVKTLDEISVTTIGEEIHIKVRARSFLHHQVRNFVGSLSWIGTGKWTKADLQKALDARDRNAGGPKAPSDGLYMVRVGYEEREDT